MPEDGSKDLFVHHSEIQSGGQFASLADGQAVEFEIGEGKKDRAPLMSKRRSATKKING